MMERGWRPFAFLLKKSVRCINPYSRNAKYYKVTYKGKDISDKIVMIWWQK